MKKMLLPTLFVASAFTAGVYAFLPISWNERWAKDDFTHCQAAVMGRIIGFHQIDHNETDPHLQKGWPRYTAGYYAKFRVARVFRGPVAKGDVLDVVVGYCEQMEPDDSLPTRIWLANTQAGHDGDLLLNGVYILFLVEASDSATGSLPASVLTRGVCWEPRCGPYSIFRVDAYTKDGKLLYFVVPSKRCNGDQKQAPLDEPKMR